MASHNLSELLKSIVTAYLADSTLVSMLGGAESIWREQPETAVAYPMIYMRFTNITSEDVTVGGKLYRAELRHEIFGLKSSALMDIAIYLAQNFKIPEALPAGISSDNFDLTIFREQNSFAMPGAVKPVWGSESLNMHISNFDCRIVGS